MTFNSHNIVSGQSGPFVLINVCMYKNHNGLRTLLPKWERRPQYYYKFMLHN